MFDSKSDAAQDNFTFGMKGRPSWKLESKFIGYSIEGGVTYRSVHQEPAPDFDGEPSLPTYGAPKDLPPYTTSSPGFAVVVQGVSPEAKAGPARFPQQRRKATAGRYR